MDTPHDDHTTRSLPLHTRTMLQRRAFLTAALVVAPSLAFGQSINRALQTPALTPQASQPPALAAAPQPAFAMMPEQSWGWLLRPGRGTTPSLLLAATGAQRAVMTIEWDTNGQLVFAGSSEDANSSAVDDLTARMLDAGGGEQGPLDQALLWGAWRQVGTQGPASTNGAPTTDGLSSSPSAGPSNTTPGRDTGTTVREGTKTWAIPIAPLTAALVGERQRARAINLGSAGAVICAFPHPGTPSSYDVTADGTQHQDLMGVLGTITQPDAPLPIAGLPGLRQSWVAQKALGALGTYRSLDGKPWAFWTLAP